MSDITRTNSSRGPGIVWLGIAHAVSGGAQVRRALDVRGLTNSIRAAIYPFNLNTWSYVFAVDWSRADLSGSIRIENAATGSKVGSFTLSVAEEGSGDKPTGPLWFVVHNQFAGDGLVFAAPEPGTYVVLYERDGHEPEPLGYLYFEYVPAPPLSEEEVQAIRSSPSASGEVMLQIGEPADDGLVAYFSIDGPQERLKESALWYEDLPDYFPAEDHPERISLAYIRRHMPSMLRHQQSFLPNGQFAASPLYDTLLLDQVIDDFGRLISSDPPEEEVQKYIQEHLVMLAPFGAVSLFLKPPILTSYFADFGLVNARRELVLIEIERPGTRLFRKNGARAAPLETAFDQVRSWLHEVDRHRSAVLRCIKGCPPEVSNVRGVVIAGRSEGIEPRFLSRLQGSLDPRVEFMTYDNLLHDVVQIVRSIRLMSSGHVSLGG